MLVFAATLVTSSDGASSPAAEYRRAISASGLRLEILVAHDRDAITQAFVRSQRQALADRAHPQLDLTVALRPPRGDAHGTHLHRHADVPAVSHHLDQPSLGRGQDLLRVEEVDGRLLDQDVVGGSSGPDEERVEDRPDHVGHDLVVSSVLGEDPPTEVDERVAIDVVVQTGRAFELPAALDAVQQARPRRDAPAAARADRPGDRRVHVRLALASDDTWMSTQDVGDPRRARSRAPDDEDLRIHDRGKRVSVVTQRETPRACSDRERVGEPRALRSGNLQPRRRGSMLRLWRRRSVRHGVTILPTLQQ